jgi:hypothetical protein
MPSLPVPRPKIRFKRYTHAHRGLKRRSSIQTIAIQYRKIELSSLHSGFARPNNPGDIQQKILKDPNQTKRRAHFNRLIPGPAA